MLANAPTAPAFVFGGVFLAAILFYQVSSRNTNTILTLIFMTAVAAAALYYLGGGSSSGAGEGAPAPAAPAAADIAGRREIVSERYGISRFPRRLRWLPRNHELAAIAADLRFVRITDRARYADLLLYLDRFQKMYLFILGGRHSVESYAGSLIDLRDSILEILYSLYFVVPESYRNLYGVEPWPILERNIDHFRVLSRKMLEIVEKFARANGAHYFPPITPTSHDPAKDNRYLP